MHTTPSQHPFSTNKYLVTLGTAAVFLYALTKLWIDSKTSAYFEATFLLPFYYVAFKNWDHVKKSKLTWLCITMLAVPILQFCIQYMQNPELAIKYQGIDKLFKLTFFIATAFWLSHNIKLTNAFIAINILSLGYLTASQPNLTAYISHTLNGARPTLGDINPQFMAIYSGISIIATCCLMGHTQKIKALKTKYTMTALGLITLGAAAILFTGGQTRAAYLGLAACLPTLIAILLLHQHFHLSTIKHTLKSRPKLNLTLSALVIIIIISSLQSNVITRMQGEISKLDISNISSIKAIGGGRGELSLFAAQKIWQQPWVGYGGESRKDTIRNSPELSPSTRTHLLHLHNSWLDFGLAYGLPGIALLTLFIGYLTTLIFKGWQEQAIPNHIAILGLLGMTFLVVVNLFESYLFFWQGSYLLAWTSAPALAYCFKRKFNY